MPMVTVKVIEGVFTQEQKHEMIRRITDTMVEIEGENLRPVTWVLVEEVHSGDWGIAGNGLTADDVHALQAQPAAAGRAPRPMTLRVRLLGHPRIEGPARQPCQPPRGRSPGRCSPGLPWLSGR